MIRQYLIATTGVMFFAGCSAGDKNDQQVAPSQTKASVIEVSQDDAPENEAIDFAAVAAAAVANPDRPDADLEADPRRKPATALEFFRVRPGMTVFEMEAGAGYYTELLSRAVTPSGVVFMHNPEGFIEFVGEEIKVRLAEGRLANVRQTLSNFDTLDAEDNSVDLITWVQGPHELYFIPSEGVSLGDPVLTYKEIFRILKPGGYFVVIDHSAKANTPETSGNDLHRIDRNIVFEMAEEAGLKFDAKSEFLTNSDDNLETHVFDPSIRGKTDQFALRFKKHTE